MVNPNSAVGSFAELRRLAAENPRLARLQFVALLDANSNLIEDVLSLAAEPGQGRIRQLIANAVRQRGDKARVVSHLRRWLLAESDEFAKAAIAAALEGVDQNAFQTHAPSDPPKLVETYRYVADRLCHRVRNSLAGPAQHLRSLESLLDGGTDAKSLEAKVLFAKLKDSIRVVSRIVDFNIDDSYFEWRTIDLVGWLLAMRSPYIEKNGQLTLRIVGLKANEAVSIRANDLLLEILFWNLWKNAQQIVSGSTAEVTIYVSLEGNKARLVVSDSGPGFSPEDTGIAFVERYSKRGANHGRGLLEVEDAARRLGGTIDLVQLSTGDYRAQLTLPLIR